MIDGKYVAQIYHSTFAMTVMDRSSYFVWHMKWPLARSPTVRQNYVLFWRERALVSQGVGDVLGLRQETYFLERCKGSKVCRPLLVEFVLITHFFNSGK